MSNVHEIQTVYNVVQDPQMVLLSEKGALKPPCESL